MKLSYLLVATTAVAAAVRWANDDEVAVMNFNRGKVGTALTMANDVEIQTMEVERMFNITPGLVPIDKMREIWKYHGQDVDENLLLHWLANSTQKAHDGRREAQVLAANQFIRAGGFGMFLSFTSDNGGTIRAVWNDCYGAATMDGTSTGKECGDKVLAALIKGSLGFVVGGLGYGAVLIQGQADPNQPIYELQNQLPPDLEHGVGALKKRSADQACPNHNGIFNGFYGVWFHLGAHIGAKLSGYAPCDKAVHKPSDAAQGSFGYQINRAAGDNGAPRIQFYTIEDGSKANIMGGAIVYETRATDTCPEYIAFDSCEE
ncbi:hypothetical protein TRIATDRAFT_308181 [Trichoderma atroviride IMI 206040]|uniref:Ecp2 effector protein domain-containing protein n=1 Tax=Hypocrea atroviridis (strain ATCC 20476 / IMI 206040) TaxID=452589 RepID=G9NTY7_HYPAI|nr:uncharacterized protein TRIATDRAFT_308181 [Trichoderma atroviride IMI 206040]EHK46174.1 hypothetical protein TRIATDRAFT_308181 [Trichoderma atroviride IMI 206040]